MKYMDGVIYMIEPDRTGLKKGLTNQYLCIRNEDIDAYYERARMLSVEEQSSVQARNFKKETLAQIMNVRDGDMKTFRENSAMEVLTALRSYVEDMKLQQMHVALAISKCDELLQHPVRLQNTTKAICFLWMRKRWTIICGI